ncbi:oxygen-independent coproporphyrinogen III oxidase [Opitutia bacterium ISCC 51]|nr:oxygen-independent coproporphyrinogen III oxidase [Opitutae bacterium ISCC 51]QXD30435.1 oxygen-independent coproporphyrinogen III oxidase [Opitutae bacterium ISCC 52]
MEVNLDLIQQYNEAGPRYTSYPPANIFSDSFDRNDLKSSIEASNTEDRPLSLYFHLPFCHSLCWFCGCNKIITHNPEAADEYLDYLEKEIKLRSEEISQERKVVQLHYGGGTPTFFNGDQLARLWSLIESNFNFSDDAELSIEIDPRTMQASQPELLFKQGFRRASLGIQDFNPQVQKAVHRIQPEEMTRSTVDQLRDAGFTSINVDLIYGLPYQTAKSFEETLSRALALNPDRFAIFNYAHVPWIVPAQRIIKEDTLPAPATKLAMLKLITETLTRESYHYIGLDHFAREEDELSVAQKRRTLQRNFQGYSTYAGVDIQAYGVSSISQNKTAYFQNEKDINVWKERLDKGDTPTAKAYVLTKDDEIRRYVILELMCNLFLDLDQVNELFSIEFNDYFADELNALSSMEQDGLVQVTNNSIEITDTGRLLIRNIAMRFDAFHKGAQGRFSKTIYEPASIPRVDDY